MRISHSPVAYQLLKRASTVFVGLVSVGAFLIGAPMPAAAATNNPSPAAMVSFTFDDGLASATTQAAPTLAKHGLTGTDYVITNCVGMTTVPNTCRANTGAPYMTWAQVQALQNTSGWEVGSHTVDHDCLASSSRQDPDDCQRSTLTAAQVTAELANSQNALTSHGLKATDIAPPYGDFNNAVLAQIAKYYASMRQFKNAANNPNVWPYSDYFLQDFMVQEQTTPVATVEAAIDKAIANKQWLVLTFHDIQPTPSQVPDDFQYGTSELDQIAAYVQSKQAANQIRSVNINQGLVTGTTNLMPNSTFDDGIADDWTTDAPATITADAGNNGSYPSPTHAVKLTSTSTTTHLFSPKVPVAFGTNYILKNFLNVQTLTTGSVGFYVDEYDANGNWVSGHWITEENSQFVEDMNFTYTPTSANVATASLQVIVSPNPGITAYLDNVQWLPATTQTATNLIANGTFDDGIADGWSTDDPANITADHANNGSPNNPVNSVSLHSGTANTHLFSPQVAVVPTKTYNLTSYLNIKQIGATPGAEVGFYMDEYDASGNWVSGHYITGVHTLGAGTVSFAYTPTSASVARASLQVILTANGGIQAYFDDVQWN